MDACLPASALARPFDAAAFADRALAARGVTLASAAQPARRPDRGHRATRSCSSRTACPATSSVLRRRRAPQLVERLVYVTAHGRLGQPTRVATSRAARTRASRSARSSSPTRVAVGALRLDVRSPDGGLPRRPARGALRRRRRALADATIRLLSSDCPFGIPVGATELTREGWGSIPRTLRALLAGSRDPAGAADALHRRGRRSVPGQPDARDRSGHVPLAVPLAARSGRRGDPRGVAVPGSRPSRHLEPRAALRRGRRHARRRGRARGARASARSGCRADFDGPLLEICADQLGATSRIAIATGILNVFGHDPARRRPGARRDRRAVPGPLPARDRRRAREVPERRRRRSARAGRSRSSRTISTSSSAARRRAARRRGRRRARARRWCSSHASARSGSTRTWCRSRTRPRCARRSGRARSS